MYKSLIFVNFYFLSLLSSYFFFRFSSKKNMSSDESNNTTSVEKIWTNSTTQRAHDRKSAISYSWLISFSPRIGKFVKKLFSFFQQFSNSVQYLISDFLCEIKERRVMCWFSDPLLTTTSASSSRSSSHSPRAKSRSSSSQKDQNLGLPATLLK
jgi:hypothetical protein